MQKVNEDYERIRIQNARANSADKFLTLEQARANKFLIDWDRQQISTPKKLGNTVFENYPLAEIAELIDWTPFFHSWEMKGSYPKILKDPERGVEATKLFNDAQEMLQSIIKEGWLKANAVVGIYAANAVNDELIINFFLSIVMLFKISANGSSCKNKANNIFQAL